MMRDKMSWAAALACTMATHLARPGNKVLVLQRVRRLGDLEDVPAACTDIDTCAPAAVQLRWFSTPVTMTVGELAETRTRPLPDLAADLLRRLVQRADREREDACASTILAAPPWETT